MQIRNEGASCDTCQFKGGHNRKQCRKCMTQDHHPGWEPAQGVKVEEYTAQTFTKHGWACVKYRRPVTA